MTRLSLISFSAWDERECCLYRDALPAAATVDRENARLIGVQSNLALPLAVGVNQSIGVLGLNTVHTERDWPPALVKRLQLVAQVFTNALARERQEHKLLQNQARLAASADLAGLAFYEVDFRAGVALSLIHISEPTRPY